MQAMTLDALSGGRFCLGIGVSGPQVIEGWHGQPFGKPIARTKETINIIRKILLRDEPVTADGPNLPLPYPKDAPNSWGLGKPLKLINKPLRPDIPIYLGAEGPKILHWLLKNAKDGCLSIIPQADQRYTNYLIQK